MNKVYNIILILALFSIEGCSPRQYEAEELVTEVIRCEWKGDNLHIIHADGPMIITHIVMVNSNNNIETVAELSHNMLLLESGEIIYDQKQLASLNWMSWGDNQMLKPPPRAYSGMKVLYYVPKHSKIYR